MIVSAFPFFNELDLLEVRCHELAGAVDLLVLVESPITWTGKPKPMHYAANAARFANSPVPIAHFVCDLPITAKSPWDREWVAHHALMQAVRGIDPEIAIWTDADEIPRGDTVERFRRMNVPAAHVDMDFVIFYFDRLDPTQRGTTAKIGKFDRTAAWHPWRGETHHPVIPDAGWHFDYFGGREHLLAKLGAFSHGPEEGGMAMARQVEAGNQPGLERTVPYPTDKLPQFVNQNRARFAHHFLNR